MNTSESSPPLSAIFVLSATALAYEVLLVRLFSVVQWHHFAFMVISIALLGYGTSGSLITVLQRWLLARYQVVFLGNTALFGLSAIACFIAVQRLPEAHCSIPLFTRRCVRTTLHILNSGIVNRNYASPCSGFDSHVAN